jgi:K+-sensing histidine kinase KdpD
LCDPSRATLTAAKSARDGSGLPRWAVVICRSTLNGDADDALEAISRDELSAPLLRRVCRGVLEQHQLRRENVKFRGDLMTFGFRVAHDLRTPLGGVLTTAEMLKEILEEDSPRHAPLTQPVIDSADGLVRLIERTSFLAKMSASTEAPLLTNMSTPFWNAFQQVEGLILKAGASLAYAAEWPMVKGHSSWLEIVWSNLIMNALQHGGPMVRIEAGWTPSEGCIRFWLTDSGTVAPERRALLFYPFNRLHEPRAPRGLGLAMVRRVIELEGGCCGYEPMSTGGSCFYFILPVATEPGEAA